MTLGHFVAFQINTAYCTKLILELRHAKGTGGWIGLDAFKKIGCCGNICDQKQAPL